MTIRELTRPRRRQMVHAVITIAAGKAKQRSCGRRMVGGPPPLGRVLRIHVVTSGSGMREPTRPAGRTCHRWRPPAQVMFPEFRLDESIENVAYLRCAR
jgi:hypothetical protein